MQLDSEHECSFAHVHKDATPDSAKVQALKYLMMMCGSL